MPTDTPPSIDDLLSLLDRAEAFISGFEDDDSQEGVTELLRDIRAAIGAETPAAWAVVQEGGTSEELYLHVSDALEDAEAFRASCTEDGGYRTSAVLEVPGPVARLGDDAYSFVEDVLQASKRLNYA